MEFVSYVKFRFYQGFSGVNVKFRFYQVFSRVCVIFSLLFCIYSILWNVVSLFHLFVVLSVLLRLMASNYFLGTFKLFCVISEKISHHITLRVPLILFMQW